MQSIENILILDNGESITFPYKIWKFIKINSKYIILFCYTIGGGNSKFTNNVWMTNDTGQIIWKIEKLIDYGTGPRYDCPYSGINYNPNLNTLTA